MINLISICCKRFLYQGIDPMSFTYRKDVKMTGRRCGNNGHIGFYFFQHSVETGIERDIIILLSGYSVRVGITC